MEKLWLGTQCQNTSTLGFSPNSTEAIQGAEALKFALELGMNFKVHTAFFYLWQIAWRWPYLDTGALTTLVHALVISRLDHCNTLYVGLPLRLMWKLQVVQNAAARLLTGMRKYQHISPTLAMLH